MSETQDLWDRITTAKALRDAAAERGEWEAAYAHGLTQGRLQCDLYEAVTGEPDPFRQIYETFDNLLKASKP